MFARRDMSIVIPFFKGKFFNLALERSTGRFNLSSQGHKRPPLVHRHKSDTKKACLIPWSQRFFLSCERRRRVVKRRERVKSLVTLDLNLTFIQTPTVKRVKLIIRKGTNGNLAITCPLGITNQTNQSY